MPLRTIKIDPATGDLAVVAGQSVIIEGAEAVAQSLRMRLQFLLGEWYLDEEVGMPYFEKILVKSPDIPRIREIFRRRIVGTPGVTELVSLRLEYDRAARKLAVTTEVRADTGEVVAVAV